MKHQRTTHPAWLRNGNLVLAFFLELTALLAYAAFGALAPEGWLQPLTGVLAAGLFVVLWAIWAAPRSKRRLKGLNLLIFKVAMFLVAAVILVLIGQPGWALVLAVLAAVNLWFARVLRQH